MDEVTQDQMRARLLPFSLLWKALQWFHSQLVETVQDWNALMRAFIKEYYSPGKTQSLHNKIATFSQYHMETISDAFERFSEYTRAVPHHKFPNVDLVQKFYQGLTMASRTIVDALAGGSIIELTPTQAFTLFKKVADNDTWASSGRLLPFQPTGNVKGVLQVEKEDILEGKVLMTRSGKETEDPEHSAGARKPKPSTEAEEFAKEEVTEIVTKEPEFEMPGKDTKIPQIKPRYFRGKLDNHFEKFVEVVRRLSINMLLLDALQVPTYSCK
jgi:hypothetical protein